MYTLQARQVTGTVILTTDGSTITGGTAVVSGTPSLSDFLADPTVSPTLNSFSVNTATPPSSSSSSSGTATGISSSSDGNISVQQPISVRTLVAICVAAFVLIAGLVLFVIWFGSRGKRPKEGGANEFYADGGNNVALDVSKMSTTTEAKVKVKAGVPVPETNVPLKAGFNSEHSSYYSQGTTRKPVPLHLEHSRRPTAESIDPTKLQLQLQLQDPYQYRYADEQSFLPKQNVYSRNDMQPVSPPRSARRTDLYNPPTNTNTNSINQSPRSTSAQAIVRPYVVGAHPYASPSSGRATSSQGRPSIEHTGNYTVAIAPGTYAGDQPYSANSVNGIAGAGAGSEGGGLGLSGHTTFAGAGSRPGYEAYGIESRQPVVQGLHTRPSLESIRTIARKASIDRTAVATATDFALGGPTAVGSRQRNDSITSSVYRGNVSSTYAGGGGGSGGGGGGGSIKSGKSGSATKEKYTKQDRAREMAAMENLIAALDESAAKEKQRKRTLAEAAGVADPAPSNNNNNNVVGSRRKDTAVTGSYPLPPAEVFRAALSMADPDDDLDDEEIERWKRR